VAAVRSAMLKKIASKTHAARFNAMSQWIEIATNAWYALTAIYFVLLIVTSVFRAFSGKWPSLLVALTGLVQLVWVLLTIIYAIGKSAPLLIVSTLIVLIGLTVLFGVGWISGVIQRWRNS
jgi:hypothetical protein